MGALKRPSETYMADKADDQTLAGVSHFGALEQRVTHLEDWFDDVKADIKALNASILELTKTIGQIGQPKWGAWFLAAGLFCGMTGTMWKLAIQPIENDVVTLKAESVPKDLLEERRIEILKQIAELTAGLKLEDQSKASKDELARAIIDFDQRLPHHK